MDGFISRKRRKIDSSPQRSSNSESTTEISTLNALDEEDSTDFKLAILSSLQPHIEQQLLLDVLLANDGDVDKASASFASPKSSSLSPSKKPSTVTAYQRSISNFAIPSKPSPSPSPTKRAKLLSKKGKTVHLYSPEDVAAHTPCTIIHNFLPADEAESLLEELLGEAPTFERMTFKLFDNVVQSPHTACFYVESLEEQRRQKTEYLYNGALLTVSCCVFAFFCSFC